MWFSASVFMRRTSPDGLERPELWEETILLIAATDEAAARAEAERLGRALETTFSVMEGVGRVAWQFDRVAQVNEILAETLENGTELFSRFMRGGEARSLATPYNLDE